MSFSRSARTSLAAAAATAVTAAVGFAAPAAADGTESDTTEPKNIIVLIGDGMGYNHVDAASLYQYGQTNWQADVDGTGGTIEVDYQDGYGQTPSQIYETFDVQLGLSHWSLNGLDRYGFGYDGEIAWTDFRWAMEAPTDSAAAGTALATGYKAWNGELGQSEGRSVQNVAEYAQATGRSAGVVTDVPFGHATPASWAVHVENRNNNRDIAAQMIYGDLDVVIGAGHPLFDDDGQERTPAWETSSNPWLNEAEYTALVGGETSFGENFVETNNELRAIANGQDVPERLFGLVPVAETFQYNRSSLRDAEPTRYNLERTDGLPFTEEQNLLPFDAERNASISLAEAADAALNVLGQNENGFFVMIEAGAVDWAGHANATAGNIEEMIAFNEAVEAVHEWVESESSWEDTLVIVTADHETGYLGGAYAGPSTEGAEEWIGNNNAYHNEWRRQWDEVPAIWTSITGEQGELSVDGWYSPDHTHHLVPLFAHGAGAELFYEHIRGTDPVRGDYVDNVDVAAVGFELFGGDNREGIQLDVTVPDLGDGGGDGALVLSIEHDGGVELVGGHNAGDRLRFLATLPTITVTDSRSDAEAGPNAGWAVNGQASDLTSATESLDAGYLGWTPALARARAGVEAGSPVATILRGGEGLAQPQTLGAATSEGRVGTTGLTAELALELPVDTRAGDYEGELTVSLFPVD